MPFHSHPIGSMSGMSIVDDIIPGWVWRGLYGWRSTGKVNQGIHIWTYGGNRITGASTWRSTPSQPLVLVSLSSSFHGWRFHIHAGLFCSWPGSCLFLMRREKSAAESDILPCPAVGILCGQKAPRQPHPRRADPLRRNFGSMAEYPSRMRSYVIRN